MPKKLTYDKIKKNIEDMGYILLDTSYVNAHHKLSLKCANDHLFEMNWNDIKSGHACPNCKGEIEVIDFIKTIYDGKIIANDRTMIINPVTNNYLELDIWMPEINKAIEYGSSFYHKKEDVVFRDSVKHDWCKENNVNLLIIDDQLWKKEKQNTINTIKRFMECNNGKTQY
jgi:hypothetical protein